jgi:type I restriction enzyme S subunit
VKAGWEVKPLGEVIHPLETVDPRRSPEREFTYIDVSSVSRDRLEVAETTTLIGMDAPSRARRKVREDDVIFATIRPTLKRIATIPAKLDRAVCSTGYMVLRANAQLDHRFLYYGLQSEDFGSAMETLQRGASYPAVSDEDIKSQPIPIPPPRRTKKPWRFWMRRLRG